MKTIKNPLIFTRLALFLALVGFSTQIEASDFNMPFFNASDLGNMYAGWAAEANDASTAAANPAGLTRLKTPQLVVAVIGVKGNTEFNGNAGTVFAPANGTASASLGGVIPVFYIAKPITDKFTAAFGESIPFGLGTSYPKTSLVRYSATRSQIVVADIGPSFGVKVGDKLSLGAGFDIDRMFLTVDNMYGFPLAVPDAEGQNHLWGMGYGAHAGGLFQVTPSIRVGLNYTTQVTFHESGNSDVYGSPLNARVRQSATIPMPALTQLSIYGDVTDRWALMATLYYSYWSVLNQLTFKNTAFPGGSASTTVPLNYHNTFDYLFGTNFKYNDKWTFKAGIEFLSTPSNNQNRLVLDPISTMILVGFGAHFQQNKSIGYDLGYSHNFFHQAAINQVNALTTANGHSNTYSNILGGQITWNI